MKKNNSTNKSGQGGILLSLVYGLINAILTVPCMYGYCAIIFSDEVYLPYRMIYQTGFIIICNSSINFHSLSSLLCNWASTRCWLNFFISDGNFNCTRRKT